MAQIGSVADAITDMGQAGKTYVTNLAGDEKAYTDTAAPIIGARTLLYTHAENDLRKAITTADNVWRNNTAQAWGTHTAGDLAARGNVRRTLANTSLLVADASQASIAEHKALWWQNEIPNYLQWSVDMLSLPWLRPPRYIQVHRMGVAAGLNACQAIAKSLTRCIPIQVVCGPGGPSPLRPR